MDLSRVVSRAWNIIWRWKTLWILGFLVALGSGGSSVASINYRFAGDEPWFRRTLYAFPRPEPGTIAVVVAVACLAILLAIALWVVSIIARGGLIGGVQQVEEQGRTSFGRAWRAGLRCFWTLLVIRLLFAFLIFVLVLVLGGILTGIAFAVGIDVDWQTPAAVARFLFPMLCCGLPLLCVGIVVGAFFGLIIVYAERAAVLESMSAIEAITRGWQVLRDNAGATLLLWLIFFVVEIVVGMVVGAILLLVTAPFFDFLFGTRPNLWWIAPIVGVVLVAAILGAVVRSILEAFTSAGWTLAYRQLVGLPAGPPQPEAEGPAAES